MKTNWTDKKWIIFFPFENFITLSEAEYNSRGTHRSDAFTGVVRFPVLLMIRECQARKRYRGNVGPGEK